MKPAPFTYARAATVVQAIELLAEQPDARLLAGGQSLGPMLNLRLARPAGLIDIKRAAELRRLEADSNRMRIGACWTHAEIEDGAVEDPSRGLLAYVARGIAYRAVRNRGTIGGSLAHADPAADWIATMALLDAGILVQGAAGTRRHAAGAFVEAPFSTALQPGELLTAIDLPRLSADARWSYLKICRKTGEFARAIGAAVLDPRRDFARVVCGATGGAPILLPRAASRLLEAGPAAAAETVAEEFAALGDPVRLQVHAVAVRRALSRMAA
jgi:carbon-monoxide dehydrogenase medium subunit